MWIVTTYLIVTTIAIGTTFAFIIRGLVADHARLETQVGVRGVTRRDLHGFSKAA